MRPRPRCVQHYKTFDSTKFDFFGSGVFQLAKTEGTCGCSSHDDVEVQTFMCGTRRSREATANAAVAVRVNGAEGPVTFMIDQSDVLIARVDDVVVRTEVGASTTSEFDVSGVRVLRKSHTFRAHRAGTLTKHSWEIEFPGGGSVLVMNWPVPRYAAGTALAVFTSLPMDAQRTGLCESKCAKLPGPAGGPFLTGVDYVGYDVGPTHTTDTAYDCAHECWRQHHLTQDPLFFTFEGTQCQCKSAAIGSVPVDRLPAPVSGRAGKKSCEGEPEHCSHVKASACARAHSRTVLRTPLAACTASDSGHLRSGSALRRRDLGCSGGGVHASGERGSGRKGMPLLQRARARIGATWGPRIAARLRWASEMQCHGCGALRECS